MALSERSRLYEVLLRGREDGTVAAHQVWIDEVLRDGVVIQATPRGPTALVLADVEALVGSLLPAIALQRDEAVTAAQAATAAKTAAVEARNDALTAKAALQAALDAANGRLTTQAARIAELEAAQAVEA